MTQTILKETQGDTLVGAIDGVNTDYQTTYAFNADTVQVYVNGRLKVRDWDDGFWTIAPNIVRLKEPLLDGDSLEIEYQANVLTGGGAPGGRPDPPSLGIIEPGMQASQNLPEIGADEVKPRVTADDIPTSQVVPVTLRPVILRPDGGNDPCQ